MSCPTSSYAIAPPSPDSTTGSDCRSCCHPAVGCQPSSSKSQHALYALPSPPLSQGCQSPSCSSRSSSRRSSASGPSSGSRLAQPPTDDAFESTSPPSSTTTLPAKSHDEHDVLRAFGLDIDNRAQMDAFMRLETTESDCLMAAEVIHLLIPSSGTDLEASRNAVADQRLLAKYLLYWTSLTPHSLCVLISTVILLERLRHLHPGLSSTGQVKDTVLRVVFSAYMAAMKACTEVSYLNSAFVGRTPWSTREINSMEREILLHLDYDCYLPAEHVLHRATAFCQQRAAARQRRYGDDGSPAVNLEQGNLFRHVAYSAAYA